MVYAVIMSGGLGSRFWPKSRKSLPKQFLRVVEGKTMIGCTVERIIGVVGRENIRVVTNKSYEPMIETMLELEPNKIFKEPLNRETATCIGMAAVRLLKCDMEAVMVVLPSDHMIDGQDAFERVIRTGIQMAKERDCLVTMGIKPTRAEAGYGYVEVGEALEPGVFKVKRFVEKPNIEVAKGFVEKGSYLWNSGMFIWRADRLLKEIKKYIPELHKSLMRIYASLDTQQEQQVIDQEYEKIDGISIDFGVIQLTHKAVVLQTDFEWDDIGSFNSMVRFMDMDDNGNAISGCDTCLREVENSIILCGTEFNDLTRADRLVAAIGLKDLLIVDTPDVLLVCPRDRCQEIKELVRQLSSDENLSKFV